MNLSAKITSALLLLVLSMVNVSAEPGQWRRDRAAQRDQQRAERQHERANRGQDRGQQVPSADPAQPSQDNSRKNGRLTPEERRTLRQQIHDAGRDVYPPNR